MHLFVLLFVLYFSVDLRVWIKVFKLSFPFSSLCIKTNVEFSTVQQPWDEEDCLALGGLQPDEFTKLYFVELCGHASARDSCCKISASQTSVNVKNSRHHGHVIWR